MLIQFAIQALPRPKRLFDGFSWGTLDKIPSDPFGETIQSFSTSLDDDEHRVLADG